MTLEQTLIDTLKARIVGLGLNPETDKWGSLSDSERDEIVGAVAEELLGQDRETTTHAIVRAFADNRLSASDLRSVLVSWAKTQTHDEVVARVLELLESGTPITTPQFVDVASAWVARQSAHEPQIAELLSVVGNGTFDSDRAWDLVRTYLGTAGLPTPILEKLEGLVGKQVTTRQIVEVVAFYAAATGPAQLNGVLEAATKPEPAQALVGWLAGREPRADGKPAADVQRLFELISKQQWLDAVAILLGGLHLGAAQELVEQLAAGTLKKFLTGELAKVIQSRLEVDADTADSIIAAVIGLATGSRSWVALAPESDAPDLTPKEVALWREIREVVYLAQLAAFGGAIVATAPGAKPHVFLAASIRYTNRISTMLKPKASDREIKEFCNALTAFLDARFQSRMTSTFQSDQVLALSLEEFKRPANQQPRCRVLQSKVHLRLREGV